MNEEVKPEIINSEEIKTDMPVEHKVSRALLEFLAYGVEKDKKIVKKMFDKLQDQMSKTKRGKYCRILWYLDNGEKTNEEKKQWLIDKSKSKYYVFTPESHIIKPHFVRDCLLKIKKLEEAYKEVQLAGIILCKRKEEENLTEQENEQNEINSETN